MCEWLFAVREDDAHRSEHKTNRKRLLQTKKLVPTVDRGGGGGGVPVVDMVSGGQTAWVREKQKWERGRDRWTKKTKTKGSCHVVTESLIDDVQCGAKAVVQVEKASLCDADDNAINPALSQPMGSAPRDI